MRAKLGALAVLFLANGALAKPTVVLRAAPDIGRAARAQLADVDVTLDLVESGDAPLPIGAEIETAKHEAEQHHAVGSVWIRGEGKEALMWVFDASGVRVLVRTLPLAEGEAGLDEVASVIRATVVSLVEGAEIALAPKPVPKPAPVVPPPARLPSPFALRVAAFYTGSAIARAIPWQSGVGGMLALSLTHWIGVFAGGGGSFDAIGRSPPIAVTRSAAWIEAGAIVSLSFERIRFDLAIGPKIEWERAVASVEADGFAALAPNENWQPALSTRARVVFLPVRTFGAFVALGLDGYFVRSRYVVEGTALEPIVTNPVRPRLEIGIEWKAF